MDRREQGQRSPMSHRRSPSPQSPRQPAPATAGALQDRSSSRGTIARQQSSTPARAHPVPGMPYGKPSGAGSQLSRSKRRRHSSSFDQEEYRQGYENEARGRDHHPPPTRRQRVTTRSEDNRKACTSSSTASNPISTRQGSRRLSPQVYHTPQRAPTPAEEEMGDDPSGRRSAPDPSPRRREVGESATIYNIGSAGNVFTGINKGIVYMESFTVTSTDDFMINLADRLKICVRAEHIYHASGDEAALRRGECAPGTRIDIIRAVLLWAINTSSGSECIFWLSGHAGAGKTTIAFTIARQLETVISDGNSKIILGGSFFCSRQFLDTRSPSSIIRTIVYQLALKSNSFRTALKQYGRFETVNHGPRSQLMGLLVEPWEKSAQERLSGNEPFYAVPIDAVDELEGTGGTEFLGTLFDVLNRNDLSGLKFFITSRSEPALVKRIASFPNKQFCRLEEVPLVESSADIKVYLDKNLVECATEQQIQQLVTDAAGLFIYAATVVEYVRGRNVEEQRVLLGRLLSTSPSSSARRPPPAATAMLDNLYTEILETSLVDPRDHSDLHAFDDCLTILHTFLCTIERTSTSVAVNLLNASGVDRGAALEIGTANGVLCRLHAVLYSQGGKVMSFHKSFFDFLFDKHRSKKFFCNREKHHHLLAEACFRIMAEQLRFNIAGIPSSCQMDCEIASLRASIETNISIPLRYACGNWGAHLILTCLEVPESLSRSLHEFLQLRVLFWMESMNLLGQRGCCQRILRDVQQWLSKCKDKSDLVSKLADSAAFAAYHSASKAALSTPHLYLSSLATFSRRSATVQNWRRQFGGIPGFICAQGVGGESLVACITLKDEVAALAISPDGANVAVVLPDGVVRILDLSTGEEVLILEGPPGVVLALAYSPDGTHIVCSSGDKCLRVWNLATGEVVRVLKERMGMVLAVAYSPDATQIAFGSSDRTLRVWSLSTGEKVRAFKKHTDRIRSVVYSPHGDILVSASDDKSLRVWNLATGKEVMVLKGHTSGVTAVAYSPSGTHVVSASTDKSVRVWDILTGEQSRILKGHTGWVRALAYSPDGSHVVSGSNDKSVRVWNLFTGEGKVFEGHADGVKAVVYFPNGTHIVSGSTDQSVRVWDLSRVDEGRVCEGHTDLVLAVAYSPDGTHAVSSSGDKSVRVWNLSTKEEEMVLKGHRNWVNAVAYSADGTHIISGSNDKSVRVWYSSTGVERRVLIGHTSRVNGVACSPDGTLVVSAYDMSVRVWDIFTGEQKRVFQGHTDLVLAVACWRDGTRVVSASNDGSVRVWDMSAGGEERALKGHTGKVLAVACSPDSDASHIVSGSDDKSLRVWDLSTGENVMLLEGHTNWVNAVAYSPCAAHVISGSYDNSIRVWDPSKGKEVKVLMGHTESIWALSFSPDGVHAVSGSGDKSVRVWNVSPEYTPRYVRQQGPDGEYTGWLLSPTDPSAYLMFVRPEALLPDDSNVLTFPASAAPHLDFSNAMFGDRWTHCYTPRPL